MKLLVIGVGNCGSRIAGAFSDLNRKAKTERRVQIVTTAYAVNNNREELASLSRAKDIQAIFVNKSFDSGKESAVTGAEIMKIEGGRVLTGIKPGDFYDTDAVFLIAATAGCFGSGGVPVLAQQLKDRHLGKPIYVLAVLPFESENDQENTVYNTAICLKSLQKITDAVFLASNEKFRQLGKASSDNNAKELAVINNEIAGLFYDILCASETIDSKMVGARSLGIGDVLQTLTGWTAIGAGKADFPMSRNVWKAMPNFQEKGSDTQKSMEAMNVALSNLSIDIKLEDTYKALYLLSIPAQSANLDMVKTLGNRLMEITDNALIRGGDFYGARDHAMVTLIFSDLAFVESIKKYFDKAVDIAKT
jgi:cell division GTPase FtsZ